MVVVAANPDPLKKYTTDMAKAKRLLLDGVKDHIVSHIATKDTAKQMWEALAALYEGSSKQRKMYLRVETEDDADAERGAYCSVPVETSGNP